MHAAMALSAADYMRIVVGVCMRAHQNTSAACAMIIVLINRQYSRNVDEGISRMVGLYGTPNGVVFDWLYVTETATVLLIIGVCKRVMYDKL